MEGPLFQMFLLFSLLFLCLTCSIKGEDVDPNQAEPASDPFDSLFNRYHTQSDLNDFLDVIVATCPNITRKYSIGKSAGGEDLWAIQMSDNPGGTSNLSNLLDSCPPPWPALRRERGRRGRVAVHRQHAW